MVKDVKKPLIVAKSALTNSAMTVKEDIGCDGIEIQLLNELINSSKLSDCNKAEDAYDLSCLEKHNIIAVHTPLLFAFGLNDVCIETLCNIQDFVLFDQVCYIANKAGELQSSKVIVVIHSESYRDCMISVGDTWKRLLNSIGCVLFKYPYIEIALENVVPMKEVRDGKVHFCNNFYDDNIVIVNELRKQLKTDRVGTVLDVCHAEMTIQIYKVLYEYYPSMFQTRI